MTIPKEAREVADGIMRVHAAKSADEVEVWIRELDMWRLGHAISLPENPGVQQLETAGHMVRLVRRSINTNDARGAAWAGMRLVHAMWTAQMLDAQSMIEAGVTSVRAADKANKKKKDDAAKLHKPWQEVAAQIRKDHPDWNNTRVARKVAKDRGGNVNTIRRAISKTK